MRTKIQSLLMILVILLLTACATSDDGMFDFYNSAQKTSRLHPGMPHAEVIKILGKPQSIQFIGNKVTLKYSLHQEWKGFVPYYVVFDKKDAKLVSWYANEVEYQQNQQMWMQVFQQYEQSQQATSGGYGQTDSGGGGAYMEGYDPNANYYTDDSYWSGSGYHYDDY